MMADTALSGLPLQARLRRVVVDAILGGLLPAGTMIPSSRDLAAALSISRNTVTLAYQHLVDEGFLESRPPSAAAKLWKCWPISQRRWVCR